MNTEQTISYQEYEKKVFHWLQEKHLSNPNFRFSLRQRMSEGAEKDYFIGKEKSGYFGTTFWNIPVSYPGSTSDFINLFFKNSKEGGYDYAFEINQTRNPKNEQNKLVMMLAKRLKATLQNQYHTRYFENDESSKYEWARIKSSKEDYSTIEEMLKELDDELPEFIKRVNEEINEYKIENPDIIATQIDDNLFVKFNKSLERRINLEPDKPIINLTKDKKIKEVQLSKNTILFGPPGTGKTYSSIYRAIAIIEKTAIDDLKKEERKNLKERFNKYSKSGQIVFSTFHQSMSYEDFIEGIKPLEPEEEDTYVKYSVQDGIFKKLCFSASKNVDESKDIIEPSNQEKFDFGWNYLVSNIEKSIASKVEFSLGTLAGKEFRILEITDRGNLLLKPKEGESREYTVSYNRLKKLFDAFPDLTKVKNIDKEFRSVIGGSNSTAYWSVLNYLHNHLKNHKPQKAQKEELKNYVLIIDEINRGNVSSIFGELITLLEDSKRAGEDEELEVVLPYSKKPFKVPNNLYIIGTMNTADRSVEALDTALRRRFTFEEMSPDYSIIEKLSGENGVLEGVNLVKLLDTVNSRLEILLDKDHTIGHSYFLGIKNLSELKSAFTNKIIPLFEEYFFGDFGKIGLVLGSSFVKKKNKESVSFAKFEDYDTYLSQDLLQKEVFTITDDSYWDFKSIYE